MWPGRGRGRRRRTAEWGRGVPSTVRTAANPRRRIYHAETTRGKVLPREYRSPRKRNSRPPASVVELSWECITYLLCVGFVYNVNWFVYIGKNPRFTAFLDSKIHTRLAIVTANELALAFPPSNLPKKCRPDPSTFYLVIVVTNKQTDRQTNQRR